MTSKIYASSADSLLPSKPRSPLFSVWALLGFTLLTAAPLLLIFPEKEMTEKITHARLGDPVTVSYLMTLLRTEPKNFELRLLLVEHKLYLGELNDVMSLLEPVLQQGQSEWNIKAHLLELDYLARLSELHKADASKFARILALRRNKVQSLMVQHLSNSERESLALQAMNLQEYGWAAELYRAYAKADPLARGEWYRAVATRMLAVRQYELAAEFYFMARHRAVLRSEQKRFFSLGIGALMSNSLFTEAMQAADQHLGNLSDDLETLYFLTKTALAANDTVRAQRYAKSLLHLSWLDEKARDWARWDFSFISTAQANEPLDEMPKVQGMRPYHAEYYDLAYTVFLANRNLDDAFRVAESAVRQVSGNQLWHQRLAEVSEWSGKPEIALREWSWLMQHGHSPAALLAILRLAPGAQEYDTLLDAWIYLANKQRLDKAQTDNIVELFEKTDRVQEGITFLSKQYERSHDPMWLERIAYLAERIGDEKTAQESYQSLLEQHDFRSDILFRVAAFQMKRGGAQTALLLLQQYRSRVTASDSTYWKLLADLAWRLQQDDAAKDAYQHLALGKKLALEDISRYIFLLGDGQREQVAALSELGYQQFGERDMLLYALEVYAALHDRKAQQRLFDSTVGNSKLDLSTSARFFLLRAQFRYELGLFKAARLDFLHAVKIEPNDQNILNAFFWFLIDSHDQAGIREMIELLKSKDALRGAFYWPALAAGYQVLEQPKQALSYFTAQVKHQPQDFLWQINYADALEQTGQMELARQTRSNAWRLLSAQRPKITANLPITPDMQAVIRLFLMNKPHDPTQQLLRSLLRQDRLIQQNQANVELLDQAVLVWALSSEQQANAKAWLWLRYTHMQASQQLDAAQGAASTLNALHLSLSVAMENSSPLGEARVVHDAPDAQLSMSSVVLSLDSELREFRQNEVARSPNISTVKQRETPVWANSLIALEENDTELLGQLFRQNKDKIPVKNRSDTAQALGSIANAQDIVFESLTNNPDDEELQARQLNYGLATSGFVETYLQHQQIATWQGTQATLWAEAPYTRDVRVGMLLAGTNQSNSDHGYITPKQEQVCGLGVKVENFLGRSELQWQRRREFAKTDAWALNHAWKANERLNLQAHALYHAETNDSLALRSMGMQNSFSGSIDYRLGRREYLNLQPSVIDYFSQQGVPLGRGKQLAWEVGYHIRRDYPDWRVSLHGSRQSIRALPVGVAILPTSSQLYSLCNNFGQSIQTQYSHAFLPYLNACLTHNPASGLGYNGELGWVGSLLGHDQVTVSFGQGMSAAVSSQGLTREFAVRYRYFFDQH